MLGVVMNPSLSTKGTCCQHVASQQVVCHALWLEAESLLERWPIHSFAPATQNQLIVDLLARHSETLLQCSIQMGTG